MFPRDLYLSNYNSSDSKFNVHVDAVVMWKEHIAHWLFHSQYVSHHTPETQASGGLRMLTLRSIAVERRRLMGEHILVGFVLQLDGHNWSLAALSTLPPVRELLHTDALCGPLMDVQHWCHLLHIASYDGHLDSFALQQMKLYGQSLSGRETWTSFDYVSHLSVQFCTRLC